MLFTWKFEFLNGEQHMHDLFGKSHDWINIYVLMERDTFALRIYLYRAILIGGGIELKKKAKNFEKIVL